MTVHEQLSVAKVAYLLQIDTGDVIHALLGVQSILIVPEDDVSPIRPFHTSLRDFLTTRARSHDLFIDLSVRYLSITMDCLAVMVVHNGYDILECKKLGWGQMWCDYLLYAIREPGSDDSLFSRQNIDDFMQRLIDFASQPFDFWVDSIILKGSITHTLQTLNLVVSALEVSPFFKPGTQNISNIFFIAQTLRQCSPHVLTMIKSIKAFAEVRRPDNYHNRKSNFAARDVVDISSYVSTVYYYEIEH
jgi:hypothetical protein